MNQNTLSIYTSIDQYHADFSGVALEYLDKMRAIIKIHLNTAEECISYNIPTFKGKNNLVHYAGFKGHIGFYPGASTMEAFLPKLKKYKTSKGTLQISYNQEIDEVLIKKMLDFRLSLIK